MGRGAVIMTVVYAAFSIHRALSGHPVKQGKDSEQTETAKSPRNALHVDKGGTTS